MFIIDNILADERIVTQHFLCDTNQCKGACCTVKGGVGAPLLDNEVNEIQTILPLVLPILSERNKSEISNFGAVEGAEGEFTTRCIEDKDCVFVYYESGKDIAKCSIEKMYFAGKTTFRKPLSCHLFPLRIADFNGPYLYFEDFEGCDSALQNGNKKNVLVYESVKEALIRAFGEDWTKKLHDYQARDEHQGQNKRH